MVSKGKKSKNQDLLEISDAERAKILKEVKNNLRQKIVEEKMWRSLLELENLVINGETIYCEKDRLTGFSFEQSHES
ncbi:MAG: hypothetical protein QXH37_03105 [Candidatus Bathyarchaeia archaeon]